MVPLLLEEERSAVVQDIWSTSAEAHAWEWVLVEVEAALVRRKANTDIWQDWRSIQTDLRLYSLPSEDLRNLRFFNRSLGLRAADVGHLFLYQNLVQRHFDIGLVTFDREMILAANRLGLPLHPACTQS